VERGAATLLEEDAMTPENVAAHVVPLIADRSERARRSREARRLGRPDAADRVVDVLDELARGRTRPQIVEALAR
jgi:UDP-N-acetylglucosamine:LPS N-acetylglucosamine transferase